MQGITVRGLIARAAVVAGAAVALVVPAVAASATQTPVTSWSPTTSAGTYDYGTLTAPSQAVSQTFTLANSGGSATSALAITVTGSAAFTKTADSCTGTSLGPGSSCTVTVRYAPASAGQSDSGTLTATANKAAATARLTLQGASSNVAVTNPGDQTGVVGTAVSLKIQASDSASGQTLIYSATGLPPGLSIASFSGLISGTPTTAGTYSTTVTARDTAGASGSTSFSWTVVI